MGTAARECLFSDDMEDAYVFLMTHPNVSEPLGRDKTKSDTFELPLVNVGAGGEFSIKSLAGPIRKVVGYGGRIIFDTIEPEGTPRKLLDVERFKRCG